MKTLLVGLCLVIGACGTEDDDEGGGYPPPSTGTAGTGGTMTPPAPINYTISLETPGMLEPNMGLAVGPWSLPKRASVTYEITNRSSTTPDRWDVGILPMSELQYYQNGQTFNALGAKANVSTHSETVSIAAGTYYLVVACRNAFERCQFSYAISALY